MTAAFLLMSSATMAGADIAPPPIAHGPAVVYNGGGCNNCGTPAPVASPCDCGSGSSRVGFFDRLKGRLGGRGKKSHDCGCAPAPVTAPCNPCATSVADRPNLFDKLKSHWGKKKASSCAPSCLTSYDPCGTGYQATPYGPHGGAYPVTPVVPGGTVPPKEMPKPKDIPKDPKPKDKGNASIPLPLPVTGGLTGSGSPY